MEGPCSPPTAGKFVVVGGGIAGVTCAEQVRRARKQFRLPETPEALALEAPSCPLSLVFLPVAFTVSLFPTHHFRFLGIRDSVLALRGCP